MGEVYEGKASMCIKLLKVLNSGRVYSVSELADLIDTKPRNVIEYKKELELMGYDIETLPGRYGGYKMNTSANIPTVKLMPQEKNALFEAYNYVYSKKDFIHKKELSKAFGSLMSCVKIEDKSDKLMVVDKYQLQMPEEKIQERYNFIEDAINAKKTIEMEYSSLKSGLKTHLVDPYKLFIYNNSWFFLGWDHEHGEVRYYKLNRMQSYKLINKTFRVWKDFKEQSYFDEHGLIHNGEYHHVEMIVTGTRAVLMQERVYGKNQIMTDLGNGSYKVSLDMQNDNTMVSFVLGCGTETTVLEPQWLIDEVKKKVKEISEKYEK